MKNFVKTAMLMAAGLGTRLRPYTEAVPKCLMPVLGIPVIQFALDQLRTAGIEKVVVNIHHLPDIAKKGILSSDVGDMEVIISDESKLLLNSAGGIKHGSRHFANERFLLLNADMLYALDFKSLIGAHEKFIKTHKTHATFAVHSEGFSDQSYARVDFDPKTSRFLQMKEKLPSVPFFAGAAVLEPEALGEVPEGKPADFVKTILNPLLKRERAYVYLDKSYWSDIGEPALWARAHFDLMRYFHDHDIPEIWKSRLKDLNHAVSDEQWVHYDLQEDLKGDFNQDQIQTKLKNAPSAFYWAEWPDFSETLPSIYYHPKIFYPLA